MQRKKRSYYLWFDKGKGRWGKRFFVGPFASRSEAYYAVADGSLVKGVWGIDGAWRYRGIFSYSQLLNHGFRTSRSFAVTDLENLHIYLYTLKENEDGQKA